MYYTLRQFKHSITSYGYFITPHGVITNYVKKLLLIRAGITNFGVIKNCVVTKGTFLEMDIESDILKL